MQQEQNKEKRMALYQNGKETAKRIIRVSDHVLAGETETTACKKENVDKSWMRRFLRSDISIKKEGKADKDIVEIKCKDWMSWQDRFLTELMGKEYYAPADFDQVYEECVAQACSEQEREILRLRFQKGLTRREVGEQIGKKQEQVRNGESNALRFLRSPQYRLKLIYGREYAETLEKVKSAQMEYDKARMARMQELAEERKKKIQECRERYQNIVIEMEEFAARAKEVDGIGMEDILDAMPIHDLGLSVRAQNALRKHCVYEKGGKRTFKEPILTVGQLAKISHNELCKFVDVGAGTVKEIENTLFEQYGIQLSRNGKKR